MSATPRISIVMASYNRRDVVLATLQRLYSLGAEAGGCEVIVVDNASADGTGEAVARRFGGVKVVSLDENLGSCAKAIGVDQAQGEYVVFLDDDSYPRPGGLAAMVAKFEGDSQLGAAGFMAHLPDGRCECSALPNVFIGCGVGFRRSVLQSVGGLDRTLFMQAEEYDLSFRLVNAGYEVITFPDLHVDHLKSPRARIGERTVYYDTRNNLVLVARYLPAEYESIYRADWNQRYGWIAESAGHRAAYERAVVDASQRQQEDRSAYADRRLSPAALEQLFRLDYVDGWMASLAADGARRIVLADLGKNVYPFVRSAERAGLEVAAIADDRFTGPQRVYRGLAIQPTAEALAHTPDAIVISNTSPIHAARTDKRLSNVTSAPIHRWFGHDVPKERDGMPPARETGAPACP